MSNTKATYPPNPYSKPTAENLGGTVFRRTANYKQLAPSVKDITFLKKMEGIFKDETNSWVAPLPFRSPRCLLPDNRFYANKRLMSVGAPLTKKRHENTLCQVHAENAR